MNRTTALRRLVTPLVVMSLPLVATAVWRDGGAARQQSAPRAVAGVAPGASLPRGTSSPSLEALIRDQNNSQSERDARLVAEGVAAFEQGDTAKARNLLQKALDLNPNN